MAPSHDNPKKFNCAEIEQLAQKYVDNQLDEQQRKLFDEHLEYCLPCDKKIQFEFKLREMVRTHARDNYSPDFLHSKIKQILEMPK